MKMILAALAAAAALTALPLVSHAASTLDGYNRADTAARHYEKMMNNQKMDIDRTDPELSAMMKEYIYGDITRQAYHCNLTAKEQHMVTLATLTASGQTDPIEDQVKGALHDGVTPLEIRETLYHLAPYVGFPKVVAAVEEADEAFKDEGISLPLPNQGTTTDQDRFDKGLAFQVNTYGDSINKMRAAAPANQKHLQDDLSAFCFGDIYTRGTLDLKTREMITVAAIGTLGSDDSQFVAHVRGYLAAGATQDQVIGVITVMNPYVGFPRTLNNLALVKAAVSGWPLAHWPKEERILFFSIYTKPLKPSYAGRGKAAGSRWPLAN